MRRGDERLFDVLDELGAVDVATVGELQIADAEPVPLSGDFAAPTYGELQALRASAALGAWRRTRRIAAAALLLLAVLASAAVMVRWLGRNSTETLGFEDALDVADDVVNYTDVSRASALLHVTARIRVGIRTVKARVASTPELAGPAAAAFEQIRAACVRPDLARGTRFASGHFASVLQSIESGEPGAAASAIDELAAAIEGGIATIHAHRNDGTQFELTHRIQLRHIIDRLDRN